MATTSASALSIRWNCRVYGALLLLYPKLMANHGKLSVILRGRATNDNVS